MSREAIAREKQLKGWRRENEIALIESATPYGRFIPWAKGVNFLRRRV